MDAMYYLCSNQNGREAIYICNDADTFESPKIKTGVYPMGTLLSKALRILTPSIKCKFNPIKTNEQIAEQFSKFTEEDTSYSNVVCDDRSARTILEQLLCHPQQFRQIRDYDRVRNLLISYYEYIELCNENKSFSSLPHLNLLVKQNNDSLPRRFLHYSEEHESVDVLEKDEINQLLSSSQKSGEIFSPQIKQTTRALFYLTPSESKTTQFGDLLTPLYVFEIHDIVDLLLASLQCIFEQKYIVGICWHCGDLYVTRNNNRRYCTAQGYGTKKRNCASEEKLMRQLASEQFETKKMHKSLRTYYANKYGTDSEIYYKYIDESHDWRDKIKRREATDAEYRSWLATKFVHKYHEYIIT